MASVATRPSMVSRQWRCSPGATSNVTSSFSFTVGIQVELSSRQRRAARVDSHVDRCIIVHCRKQYRGNMMQISRKANSLEEQLRRNVETLAEAPDLFFRQFSLTANHFGNGAARTEDLNQVFLLESVFVHQEGQCLPRCGARQLVTLLLKIFDQPVSYTHLRAHETVLDLVC